ncbi:hypothetical protein EQV13_17305 [Salmonella enterica]|nr:hypothetical protein [Salmonella enterica]EAR0727375.1 hypothetical protein [Salmonella enterica]EAR5624115.1 hypothetical protein [Salmonella enterica]EBJ4820077.1 hypothetical protein [Salmonella enterica]ECT9285757.1 hypothetical protein [Salmonella enterica subsp. enterica serovar Thompson]
MFKRVKSEKIENIKRDIWHIFTVWLIRCKGKIRSVMGVCDFSQAICTFGGYRNLEARAKGFWG